ncbi:MAG TPA: potassium-transporting ATPase subunit KdpB [Dehalococcoidia bacterium]|nr:potassium-transporting ATPase subunit KdpB [Dehalococcoidia bacterium]
MAVQQQEPAQAPNEHRSDIAKSRQSRAAIWNWPIVRQATIDSFKKLNPRHLLGNPVMLVVEIGAAVTTYMFFDEIFGARSEPKIFTGLVSAWLWFTVLFANFAEAMAEGRGKAQANTLRSMKRETMAQRERPDGSLESVASSELRVGDVVRVDAPDDIPGDGDVIDGVAYVSEAAITGESAPVLKEPGTDIRSSVTGGTTVVSDWLRIRISANPGESFLDRMIALVEGAARQKTPNEVALNILLATFTIIFLLAVGTIRPYVEYVGGTVTTTALIALLVCLIPTTIGGLLSAIGIAGMDRMVQRNVLAMSGKAVETAGDIDTLLLDKTGTITFGNRLAAEFIPVGGHTERDVAVAALQSSLADETPEGRSVVALAKERGYEAAALSPDAELIPFKAETRMSGVHLDGHRVMKGAVDAVARLAHSVPPDLDAVTTRIAMEGGTPLAVVDNQEVLGVIYLKDTVKPGIREKFEEMRRAGIRTVMITGDNRLTAATIAAEAGVDDFVAEVRPEDKMQLIRDEQAAGRLVAMTGDGTNDAPALAQADVGVAMNSGTAAAKEAANMVDLDSDPTKLMEVVAVGKQMLMTRGALTTFSISNDVSKYFAIIPALFVGVYPQLDKVNIMRLSTPQSAILSAVIFNALIIVALVPLALRGVTYRAATAANVLRGNLLIYGVGGLIAPFIGIKLIDLLLVLLHLN